MKIVLAPDKYKGSLTGIEFCNAVEEGIKSVIPKAEIVKMPLADGGDGTIEILDYHLEGKHIKIKVNNPLFRPIVASYLFLESSHTAFIEMAEASGMKLLSREEQNCMKTTTYGTGEMIQDAMNRGAKTIILGLGSSATNDCGMGMATALGYKFLDAKGNEIVPIATVPIINPVFCAKQKLEKRSTDKSVNCLISSCEIIKQINSFTFIKMLSNY